MIEFAYKPGVLWWWVGVPALAALLAWSYYSARGGVNGSLRTGLFTLRVLALAVIILCLLDPQRVEEVRHYQPAHVAVLLDTSRSMGWVDDSQRRLAVARGWIKTQLKVPANFSVSYYGFSTNLYPLAHPNSRPPPDSRTERPRRTSRSWWVKTPIGKWPTSGQNREH